MGPTDSSPSRKSFFNFTKMGKAVSFFYLYIAGGICDRLTNCPTIYRALKKGHRMQQQQDKQSQLITLRQYHAIKQRKSIARGNKRLASGISSDFPPESLPRTESRCRIKIKVVHDDKCELLPGGLACVCSPYHVFFLGLSNVLDVR